MVNSHGDRFRPQKPAGNVGPRLSMTKKNGGEITLQVVQVHRDPFIIINR